MKYKYADSVLGLSIQLTLLLAFGIFEVRGRIVITSLDVDIDLDIFLAI
jgi:hypothetical protein